jgi:radical SAM superfamily enzyme YgiQ (UPF0313 family)
VRLYLINPHNPLVSLAKKSRWSKYRVWKPLGLLILAGLTPPEWEIRIIDENLGVPDYGALPRPDLVGITAFTSQATRAYELAVEFRDRGVPVVMGGVHATLCLEEAMERVDSVVTGEAESVWAQVLEDARQGLLEPVYAGEFVSMEDVPPARNDLLTSGYAFGSIQTTRGCPLDCSFCSVSVFNGNRYRQRPIEKVVEEFQTIRERLVLIVDDNLVGTSRKHIARAKDLFRAMIHAKLRKKWICQATINMADDDELLMLAAQAGCKGVFVGFESPTEEGLADVGKKFNILKGRDFRASVGRIQRRNICVVGSFIMGLDTDERGIGKRIADAAERYGVDLLNVLFLTPLPGTRLWDRMKSQGRIAADSFPEDWRYFTLTFPVARYKHLSWAGILQEMDACDRRFYSLPRILHRIWSSLWRRRGPLFVAVSNLSFRHNLRTARGLHREADASRGQPLDLPARAESSGGTTSAEKAPGS